MNASAQVTAEAQPAPASSFVAEYGRRRGWLANLTWSAALRIGALRQLRHVDWTCVQRFVFVCRGNICRSPYAARRARAAGLRAFSCGLYMGENTTVDPTAAMVARRRGLDLSSHQPRALMQMRVEPCDLLVAMEPAHLRPLQPIARSAGAQLTLIGLWSTPRRVCLTDPYGLCEEYFNRCFMLIDSAVARMSAALTEAPHGPSGE